MLLEILCMSLFAQDVPDMFPDSIGNYWQYEYGLPNSGRGDYKSITDTITFNNKHYFVLETRVHDNTWEMFLRKDSLGNIWRYYGGWNQEILWFDFSLPDNSIYHWATPGSVDSFNVKVYHHTQIETFAGTFENCSEFFFDIPGWYDEEQWYVFAPDMGIVKEQWASIQQLLSSASINGKTITGINQESYLNNQFTLEQNFPNPFNPSTDIRFSLMKESDVTLRIFDVRGREIAALLNDKMAPGQHRVTWKPEGLPSGIYFYQLETKDFLETKKMVFLE